MSTYLRPALMLFIILTIIVGVIYPLLITGIGRLVFPYQVAGSLLWSDGHVVGSALIGQNFTARGYFWGRPSATLPIAYNSMASGGSNLGPLNPLLLTQIKARTAKLYQVDPQHSAQVPIDIVTASASGLDPDISPAAALYQLKRVATERHLPIARLQQLVKATVENRQMGFIGEPRVNVLKLNLHLDQLRDHRHE